MVIGPHTFLVSRQSNHRTSAWGHSRASSAKCCVELRIRAPKHLQCVSRCVSSVCGGESTENWRSSTQRDSLRPRASNLGIACCLPALDLMQRSFVVDQATLVHTRSAVHGLRPCLCFSSKQTALGLLGEMSAPTVTSCANLYSRAEVFLQSSQRSDTIRITHVDSL